MSTPYELVAAEYYDAALHPTCANLRAASDVGLALLLEQLTPGNGRVLEIGAGASAIERHPAFAAARVVTIDLSPAMLVRSGGLQAIGNALHLPFRGSAFDGVYGSLADPYNTRAFYAEAIRVLAPDGVLAFSVPDVRWVRANQAADNLPEHTAGFVLRSGGQVLLPSIVHEYEAQERALRAEGFAKVERIQVPLDVIPVSHRSPRFAPRHNRPTPAHIISWYIGRKQ